MHLELEGNSGRQDIITWTKSGQDISINILYSYKKISEGLLVKDISCFEYKPRQWKTWSVSALLQTWPWDSDLVSQCHRLICTQVVTTAAHSDIGDGVSL